MKEIKFCRATRDYEMFLDGRSVGFAATHRDAEVQLNQLMYDQLAHDAPTQITLSRSAGHRQERLDTILNAIAVMPEPAQSQAINFFCDLIEGSRAAIAA